MDGVLCPSCPGGVAPGGAGEPRMAPSIPMAQPELPSLHSLEVPPLCAGRTEDLLLPWTNKKSITKMVFV